MDKKPMLGSDTLEWIRDTRKVKTSWYVSEDNVKEFFNKPEAKWGGNPPGQGGAGCLRKEGGR